MATPVSELELLFISMDPARRRESGAKLDPETWLFETELGYTVSGHEHITAVLRDRNWHSELTPAVWQPDEEMLQWMAARQPSLLSMNGEDHRRLRRVVGPWLTPNKIEGFRELMRSTIDNLLGQVVDRGESDFISAVSEPYATHVVFDLVGASPAWRERFRVLANERSERGITMASPSSEVIAISEAFDELVGDLIQDPVPPRPNSLLEVLRLAESDGSVSRPEAVMLIQSVIGGAADSVLAQLGSAVSLFARFEDQYQLLRRQPSLAAQAGEEVMRLQGAARGTTRVAVANIEYNDVLFPTGTGITLSFVGANRDPAVFDDGNRFDISRENAAHHLSFGHGAHFCIGAALARAEMTEALAALARRVERIEIVGEVRWRTPTSDFWGPAFLPVCLHSATL